MKTKRLLASFALGLGLVLALLWAVGGRVAFSQAILVPVEPEKECRSSHMLSSVITVCASGCDYATVQGAIDASGTGDVIKVAEGVYSGVRARSRDDFVTTGAVTQVVYISKTITIQGGYTTTNWAEPYPVTQPTTLDAQGQGRGIYVTGGISPTLEGLRVANGTSDGLGGHRPYSTEYDAGGGIYVFGATVTISDCQVLTNTSPAHGGGLYLGRSDAVVSGSTVVGNTAGDDGGGLYVYEGYAVLSGNAIVNNRAPNSTGGGLYVDGNDGVLSDNDVVSNTAQAAGGLYLRSSDGMLSDNRVTDNLASGGNGGGIFLSTSDPTLTGNTVSSNTAYYNGGGLYLSTSDAVLMGNTVANNTTQQSNGDGGGLSLSNGSNARLIGNRVLRNVSGDDGGGLYLYDSNPVLDNNVIADNQASDDGAGLYVYNASPYLRHTTLARNDGNAGLYVYSSFLEDSNVTLVNTILVSHTTGLYVSSGNTATLTATLWGSGTWANATEWSGSGVVFTGTVNPRGLPDFVDYGNGDYHIGASSAAVDAGVSAGLLDDIDGNPRPAGFGYDVGADERTGPVLGLYKAAQPGLVNPGATVTYTILITNSGTAMATNVVLTDTLPGQQQPITATASQGSSCTVGGGWGGQAVCPLGNIGLGGTARVTLTAQATTTLPGSLPYLMVNTVRAEGGNASNEISTGVYLHDCHVRVNGGLPEYADVQTAVDAASEGATVMVAGTCTGVGDQGGLRQVVYVTKTLTVRGGYSSTNFLVWNPVLYPTVLDAEGQGRVVYVTGAISPVLEGLHVTGGDAAGLWGGLCAYSACDGGGGIYILTSTATLSNSWVYGNTADGGGGIYLKRSGATLKNNVFTGNVATEESDSAFSPEAGGGGVCVYDSDAAVVISNTIQNNIANDSGGGMYLRSSDATVSGNMVLDNIATGIGSVNTGDGGGIYVDSGNATLVGNTVLSNTGRFGGGVALDAVSSGTVLSGNTILSNTASENGGGLFMVSSSATVSDNIIRGNAASFSGGGVFMSFSSGATVAGNRIISNTASSGGGFSLFYTPATLSGNTVLRNTATGSGGGFEIYSNSHAKLFNNVIADNQAGNRGSGVFVQESDPRFVHTTIARNTGGDGSGICARITSTVSLTNTIMASQTVGITATAGSAVTVHSILWFGNGVDTGGSGAIAVTRGSTGFPAFLPDGYHIATNSAARDAGVNAGVSVDIDENPRPQGDLYDVGADELLEITIDGGTGGTITHVGEGGQTIVVQAVPGTVSDTVTLAFAAIPSSTLPISPGVKYSGIAFDLDAFCYTSYSVYLPLVLRNYSVGSKIVAQADPVRSIKQCGMSPSPSPLGSSSPCSPTFQIPVTITIQYSGADVAGLVEDNLRLYYWTGSYWKDAATTCIPASTYITNTTTNLLQVPICHLSQYSMR